VKKSTSQSVPLAAAPPAELASIFNEVIDRALALIQKPTREPDEDIHGIRLSIKRLRALLLMIEPVIAHVSYERENARLRDAARLLATSRDTAIARKTLAALSTSVAGKRNRDAFARAIEGADRSFELPTMIERAATLRKVAAALKKSRQYIPLIALPEDKWRAIGPGLEAVYRAGRKRMDIALAGNDNLAFHRWRIRVNRLFYILEMLAPIWPAGLGKTVCRLKELQGKLGEDHDLVVLISILEAAPNSFGGNRAVRRVIGRIDQGRRKLRRECRNLGRSIYRKNPCTLAGYVERHWRKWQRSLPSMSKWTTPVAIAAELSFSARRKLLPGMAGDEKRR
jgi:CHAD domain-containing protein